MPEETPYEFSEAHYIRLRAGLIGYNPRRDVLYSFEQCMKVMRGELELTGLSDHECNLLRRLAPMRVCK